MSLVIEDFGGRCEVNSISDFEDALQKRYGSGVNEYWISHDEEKNPVLALLINGNLSCVHYFPYEGHPGFVCVGNVDGLDKDGFTTFSLQTVEQKQEIWNRHVIPLSKALMVTKDFFASKELPKSIEWNEL
jgi:hypothetical protein